MKTHRMPGFFDDGETSHPVCQVRGGHAEGCDVYMYALRQGLSYCVIDETVVFLDVSRDRYFALVDDTAKRFLRLATDFERSDAISPSDARPFVSRGILVENGEVSDWRCPQIFGPDRECAPCDDGSPSWRLLEILRAIACIVTILLRIRVQPFGRLIRAQRPLRPRATPAYPTPTMVGSFLTACHVLPWRLECLPMSLALRAYLRSFSISSDLVLAVCLNPFAAHCWVEIGDMVLGDTLERISPFTPIRRVS